MEHILRPRGSFSYCVCFGLFDTKRCKLRDERHIRNVVDKTCSVSETT